MKTKYIFAILSAFILTSCAQSLTVSHKSEFHGKTGIIGVFQQPVGFCGKRNQQLMVLGGDEIVAKPIWSGKQDNLFSAHLKSGNAELTQYSYTCESKDSTITPQKKIGVVIPAEGFCKIVISFLPDDVKNQQIFKQDEDLLRKHFHEEKVAIPYENIPFCKTF